MTMNSERPFNVKSIHRIFLMVLFRLHKG
jgi:hypothetical protein